MGELATRVYFKSTHALLQKSSYHPKHTSRGIIKSQLIRFHCICSLEEDVEVATNTLFAALRPRGYSRRFLRHIKAEVKHSFDQYRGVGGRDPQRIREFDPLCIDIQYTSVRAQQTAKGEFWCPAGSSSWFQRI